LTRVSTLLSIGFSAKRWTAPAKENRVRTNVSARQVERRFFAWCAALIVLLVFARFSRTYFLHTLFQMPAPSSFLRIHGAVMSGWIGKLED
jgi:hypothetical protein